MERTVNINSMTIAGSATSTSSRVTITGAETCDFVNIENVGSEALFAVSGDSTVVAVFPTGTAQSGSIIPAGKGYSLRKEKQHTHVALITASGSVTYYAQFGNGG